MRASPGDHRSRTVSMGSADQASGKSVTMPSTIHAMPSRLKRRRRVGRAGLQAELPARARGRSPAGLRRGCRSATPACGQSVVDRVDRVAKAGTAPGRSPPGRQAAGWPGRSANGSSGTRSVGALMATNTPRAPARPARGSGQAPGRRLRRLSVGAACRACSVGLFMIPRLVQPAGRHLRQTGTGSNRASVAGRLVVMATPSHQQPAVRRGSPGRPGGARPTPGERPATRIPRAGRCGPAAASDTAVASVRRWRVPGPPRRAASAPPPQAMALTQMLAPATSNAVVLVRLITPALVAE